VKGINWLTAGTAIAAVCTIGTLCLMSPPQAGAASNGITFKARKPIKVDATNLVGYRQNVRETPVGRFEDARGEMFAASEEQPLPGCSILAEDILQVQELLFDARFAVVAQASDNALRGIETRSDIFENVTEAAWCPRHATFVIPVDAHLALQLARAGMGGTK